MTRAAALGAAPSARALRAPPPAPVLPRVRATLAFAALALAFAVLAGRALYLQWFDNAFLQERGAARYSREIEVPAHRGRILDRFGDPLAISTPVKSLWAFPAQFDATREQLAALARVLDTTPQALAKRVASADDFAYLAKEISPEVAERALALGIHGLNDENAYRRYYPGGEVTGQVVGFTGDRDAGQEGMELAQQAWLAGVPGSRRVIVNRRGDIVEDVASIRAPQEGRDLALSLDSRLQYIAYRELKSAVEANKAKAGGMVVIDAHTGEILALANYPSYNPNSRERGARERMRNRALTDVFEPGSTLKPFTIAAALDAGKVRPDTRIDTNGGVMTIGSATIHDAHREGILTVEQVIQKSSNIGAARIALSLPPATMWHTLSEAGFGTPPRTGFPGEVGGRLRPAKTWKPIEQATISYGHGISVNLVQLAHGYMIFTGAGDERPVTLLRTDGTVAGKPVITAKTAGEVRHMLEMVTQPGGTAPRAQVPGYRVAGKTGTAHKLANHVYTDKYVASFVGFAPVSNPRLIVAVMIDEPEASSYYGGDVAAPVFATVMGASLRMLGVPTDAPLDNVVLPPPDAMVREET
jgi:cell division protein FtsI (penicillin-binding protein 3)